MIKINANFSYVWVCGDESEIFISKSNLYNSDYFLYTDSFT